MLKRYSARRPAAAGVVRSLHGQTRLLIASGLAVAHAYLAHPMLDLMSADVGLQASQAGWIVGATQVGYGLGLLLLAPLGDLMDRRRHVVLQSAALGLAACAVSLSRSPATLLGAAAVMGLLAVVTQAFVALAAVLADDQERGQVVGQVTSGIVVGLLLARTAAGALADIVGWRGVYLTSGAAMLLCAGVLSARLPRRDLPRSELSYGRLIASMGDLILSEPTLRVRATLAALIFAAVTIVLTPLVLPLSAPPYALSHAAIGGFGLVAAAGAVAAAAAGRWTDAGHGQRATFAGLLLMLVAWGAIASLPSSLGLLAVGLLMLDFGLQTVHVASQGLIYRVRPDAQGRLTAAYMVFYSAGSAAGSSTSTWVYAAHGWTGVSILGASVSAAAIVFWAVTRPGGERGPRGWPGWPASSCGRTPRAAPGP
ncbi:MFS transporter [Phenylobacterium sp. LjRoot219]|uniref:MFS transporter n=1 Tax=Phenylobacterium sp. LjRoot219 TaxID=3342283 RepID=UPI003ED06C1C